MTPHRLPDPDDIPPLLSPEQMPPITDQAGLHRSITVVAPDDLLDAG